MNNPKCIFTVLTKAKPSKLVSVFGVRSTMYDGFQGDEAQFMVWNGQSFIWVFSSYFEPDDRPYWFTYDDVRGGK